MKHASRNVLDLGRLDPWPLDTDGWPYVPRHTSDWVPPTWDEWIMGVPPGWLADGVA
jgi:hypothetical protein